MLEEWYNNQGTEAKHISIIEAMGRLFYCRNGTNLKKQIKPALNYFCGVIQTFFKKSCWMKWGNLHVFDVFNLSAATDVYFMNWKSAPFSSSCPLCLRWCKAHATPHLLPISADLDFLDQVSMREARHPALHFALSYRCFASPVGAVGLVPPPPTPPPVLH